MAMAAAPMATTLSLARDESEAELIGVGMKRTLTMTATFAASSDAVTIELIPSVTDTVFAFVKIVSTGMGRSIFPSGHLGTFSKRKGSEYSDTVCTCIFRQGGWGSENVSYQRSSHRCVRHPAKSD